MCDILYSLNLVCSRSLTLTFVLADQTNGCSPNLSPLPTTNFPFIYVAEAGNVPEDATFEQIKALAGVLSQGPDDIDQAVLSSAAQTSGIPTLHVEDALGVGDFGDTVAWKQFLTLLCASIPTNGDLLSSLAMTVDALFGEELMPVDVVKDLYKFVSDLDPSVTEEDVAKKLGELETAASQTGKVSKSDIFGDAAVAPAAAAPAAEAEPASATESEAAALAEPEAAAESEAPAAGNVAEASVFLLAAAAEVPVVDAFAAAAAAGFAAETLEVVGQVGKFAGDVSSVNYLALLCANDANDFAGTAMMLKALVEDADAAKAAIEFVGSLDEGVSAEDVAAALA
jgi:hypothetical protein